MSKVFYFENFISNISLVSTLNWCIDDGWEWEENTYL